MNAPSFIGIGITINGEKLDLAKVNFSDFTFSLDMHQGLLSRSFIYEGKGVKVKFEFERFLHITLKEAALIQVKITVLSGNAKIDFDSTLMVRLLMKTVTTMNIFGYLVVKMQLLGQSKLKQRLILIRFRALRFF